MNLYKPSSSSIMYFVRNICDIFHPQYLDVFKIVFICKACKIILYELSVTIILDALHICSSVGKTCDFFSPTTRYFLMCFYL